MGENALTRPHLHIYNNIIISDLASQIKLGSPIAEGSFGEVYRCAINEGKKEVAVKVFRAIIHPQRSLEKLQSVMDREVAVWLKLSESAYIVPLLGIAKFSPPESLPALVSEWMPSGTLNQYLKKYAETLEPSARVELSEGVAGGINYLRLEEVVHGDLHPANVLIDREGNPRLTDFGLAIVVGDSELQWGTTTAARELNARWRAPEVLGIEAEAVKPTFMSDIYSLGSILFFIISGDIPWKEKRKSSQISVELSKKTTPTRPENILNGHWNLIQKCWSWKARDRPESTEVLECIKKIGVNDSQASIPNQPVDLTGQIIGLIDCRVAGGNFTDVYKCECKQASGRIKVAVKIIKFGISKEELERFHHETKKWGVLKHDHIVRLLGTAREFGPSHVPPVLVFPWFETVLPDVIREQGTGLSIRSKLDLLLGTASALEYLHGLDIVHGDATSSNILVDISDGRYHACLTDIGLATILGGHLGNRVVDGSHVQLDAVRWTPPELLNDGSPTKKNDMYSFGCIMFHLLTLYTPWYTITNDLTVVEYIRRGEQMSRPAPSESLDLTDARWNMILKCWSAMVLRPSASMVTGFLRSELEALSADDKTICGLGGEHAVPLIKYEADKPSPATLDLSPRITNAPCDGIRRCLPVDVSASEVTDVSDTSIDGHATFVREQSNHQRTSSDMFDAEQRTASGDVTHPTREEDLQPPSRVSPNPAILRNSSGVSTLLPLNVLLFGEIGVDKSSIIQLIVGQDIVDAVPGGPYPMLKRTAGVTLGERRFELWEVSSSMSFFPRFIAKWRLRASYKRLYRDGGAPLVLYCMKGKSTPTTSKEYQDFTDIVGSTSCVSISAVVDGLEESLTNMDDWWTKYKGDLIRLGIQFSDHVCITLLPDDPNALRSLIESYASYPRHTS